ncbi:SulP family inorganic anion transporter [Haloimpatiens sp. FM7330]|uniref:SulP family inorganic anion transporter n=1 Tax=Haloimpatiens sp. FM7330 TaxID=3298610 RepID=UPI003635A324
MIFKQMINKEINVKKEVLSGLTVALALVPEAVAFAIVAGVKPLVGLYAAFLVGFITSILGGRPGMISGATGALAVVMVELVAKNGVDYLFLAVIVMGIIEIIIGLLKLGKFVRFIPQPVMLGFVNGLAIVIFLAQLNQFKVKGSNGELQWMAGTQLWTMIGLVLLTMVIIYFLPKLTKVIPAALAAIVTVSLLVNYLGIDTKIVGDVAKVGGRLPQFRIPHVPLNLESFKIILPYSLIFASIGLMESLMTLTLIDEITETRGRGNRECIGQGIANIVTGFFGGMGGCAMIGQSMININSGGRKRLSGISAAIFLLGFILFGSSLIERIPLAALTGVMFMVVIGTFEWASFRIMKNIPKSDAFVIVLVSIVTVFTDLAIAVATGVIVSALVFAWKKGKKIDVEPKVYENGIKEYYVRGAVFFGSARDFVEVFDIKNDPNEIIIDFKYARVFDHSGIDAINTLTAKYRKLGKKLHLRHLSSECHQLIKEADDILEVNIIEDPTYHVADDALA